MNCTIELPQELIDTMIVPEGMKFTGKLERRKLTTGDLSLTNYNKWGKWEGDRKSKRLYVTPIFTDDPVAKHKANFDKWIKDNNIKVGDKVKVMRKPKEEEREVFHSGWIGTMESSIGSVLEIFTIDEVEVKLINGSNPNFRYPHYVLEKVQEPEYVDVEVTERDGLLGVRCVDICNQFTALSVVIAHKDFVCYIWYKSTSKILNNSLCYTKERGHCEAVRFKNSGRG
jgi:hypothetical protein